MYISIDSTEEQIIEKYYITKVLTESGRYHVLVKLRSTNDIIGEINAFNNSWKISTDPTFESGDLMKAIKRCVDRYMRYEHEFNDVFEVFNKNK